MIDEQWLRGLEFDKSDGSKVTGLAGRGSQFLVFWCTEPDGTRQVIKTPNCPHLGWVIREIPPDFAGTRVYDVARLNEKLLRLVGNDLLDGMSQGYDELYAGLLGLMHRDGFEGLTNFAANDDMLAESLAFILRTPGMQRRLKDLALLNVGSSAPDDVILLNEWTAPIEDTRDNLARWAEQMLSAIASAVPCPPHFKPMTIPQNPLYVWGAAVLDGFFTTEEMQQVLEFITRHFGQLTKREDRLTIAEQVFALQILLARCLGDIEKARRFVKFCSLAGFHFVNSRGDKLSEENIVPARPKPASSEHKSSARKRVPKLAPPSSVRPFQEEGHLDPLGQNQVFWRAALLQVAKFLGGHAQQAHRHGVAVNLPKPATGLPEPYWKPWRSTIDVSIDESGVSKEHVRPLNERDTDRGTSLTVPPVLRWLQRCLVSLSVFSCELEDDQWTDFAEALENFGYLGLCRVFDVKQHPRLNAIYEVGSFAAKVHGVKGIIGDLHPGNFKFENDGKLQGCFDLGRGCMLDRPLTSLERASDFAVLKKHCGFLEWEAAKAGYRAVAPEEADAVFAHFDLRSSDKVA